MVSIRFYFAFSPSLTESKIAVKLFKLESRLKIKLRYQSSLLSAQESNSWSRINRVRSYTTVWIF